MAKFSLVDAIFKSMDVFGDEMSRAFEGNGNVPVFIWVFGVLIGIILLGFIVWINI